MIFPSVSSRDSGRFDSSTEFIPVRHYLINNMLLNVISYLQTLYNAILLQRTEWSTAAELKLSDRGGIGMNSCHAKAGILRFPAGN